MSDVTLILSKIEAGDSKASEELLPLVYDEPRRLASARMANERSDHTLQATGLVHEAYLRLVDAEASKDWDNRGHFFAAAAEAMRRILIESARRRQSLKRGGDHQRVELADHLSQTIGADPGDLIDFNEALQRLEDEDPQAVEFVKLRLFAGFSVSEAGRMLGMPSSTSHDNWEYARAWFSCQPNHARDLTELMVVQSFNVSWKGGPFSYMGHSTHVSLVVTPRCTNLSGGLFNCSGVGEYARA